MLSKDVTPDPESVDLDGDEDDLPVNEVSLPLTVEELDAIAEVVDARSANPLQEHRRHALRPREGEEAGRAGFPAHQDPRAERQMGMPEFSRSAGDKDE